MNRPTSVSPSPMTSLHRNMAVRWSLLFAGNVFISLGILGIFLPLVPTTVFLLLAAWCYARSSQRVYDWLLQNKYFGSNLRNYREGRGITLASKILSLSVLWITVSLSVVYGAESWIARLALIVVAVGVTVHLASIPTFVGERSADGRPTPLLEGEPE